MKERIVLLGPPASGKGTQAEMIAARFGIPITSPGAMLRAEKARGTVLGVEADRISKQGMLLPDSTIVELVEKWLIQHDGRFVFDGFPRTIGQADALESILEVRDTPLDVALVLDADLETLQRRIAGRLACPRCGAITGVGLHVKEAGGPCPRCGGALGRRSDDTPETLAVRMLEYEAKSEPLIEYYASRDLLRRVESTSSPDAVFAAVAAILEGA